MQYQKIPYVDQPVSRILFGTSMELLSRGGDGTALLDAVFEMGINAFDCARVYGQSERALGRWMAARQNRDRVVLLSKGGHPDLFGRKRLQERAIRKDLARSLEELGTDYVDIYLLHRDDPAVEVGQILELCNALHAEGKIRAFGGSNWTHQRIEAANDYAYRHNLIPFAVSSPHFSLAEQQGDLWGGGCVTVTGSGNQEARAWYRESQLPLVAYSSLGRGFFSGKLKSWAPEQAGKCLDRQARRGYLTPNNLERLRRCEVLAQKKDATVAQIALAWMLRQDMNTFAVVSTSRPERMAENIRAMELELTPEELRWLDLRR